VLLSWVLNDIDRLMDYEVMWSESLQFIYMFYSCIEHSACGVFGIAKHPDRDTRVGTFPATRADITTAVSAGRVPRPERPRTLR
jgi:hypothetical protein